MTTYPDLLRMMADKIEAVEHCRAMAPELLTGPFDQYEMVWSDTEAWRRQYDPEDLTEDLAFECFLTEEETLSTIGDDNDE